MKSALLFLSTCLFFISCGNEIKNKNAAIEIEKGTDIINNNSKEETKEVISEDVSEPNKNEIKLIQDEQGLIGFWVGYFKADLEEDNASKELYVDEGYYWARENKINISIDKITDDVVIGHSVVAGNDRPFQGSIKKQKEGEIYSFEVKEPGDHKYDGKFSFIISDNKLIGTWEAYGNIDIKKRKYELEKKEFKYNPDRMLERAKDYVNWNKYTETEISDEEMGKWIEREFSTSTELIYKINASNTILKKETVENLKKGDLTIIRNSIYARHGYSFKNRPLRVFFDAQDWYIPLHTNIKNDFTEIEIKNIQLMLKYEKNAAEYYDRFGRG